MLYCNRLGGSIESSPPPFLILCVMTCLHAANCTCLAVIEIFCLLDFEFDYSDMNIFNFIVLLSLLCWGVGVGGGLKLYFYCI